MSRYPATSFYGNENLVSNAGMLVEGFETASDWTAYGAQAAGAAVTNNTADYKQGAQSLTFSATGIGSVRRNKYISAGINLSEIDTLSMLVKWDKVSASSNMTLYLSSDAATVFINYKAITLTATQGSTKLNGGWTCLVWRRADMTISGGTINWAAVTNINIACNMQGANESCIFDAMYIGRRTRSKLVMCFDDGVEDANFSQVTQAGVALSYGIPVSLFVIPRLVNGTGYVTTAQLTTLKAAGHLIAGHSDANGGGDFAAEGYTAAQVNADMQTTVDFLNANGFSDGAAYYAWPGGKYESTDGTINYATEAQAVGINYARSIAGVIQTNNNIEHINQGIQDPYTIIAAAITTTPAVLLAIVDLAISRGTSVFFYAHKISAGAATPAGYEITGDDFATFCAGVQTRIDSGLLDATTFTEFANSYADGGSRYR